MAEVFYEKVEIHPIPEQQQDVIILDATTGTIVIGGHDKDGYIVLKDAHFHERIELDGKTGKIALKDREGRVQVQIAPDGANIWLGGKGQDGDLYIFPRGVSDNNNPSLATIHLEGQNGNVTLKSHDGFERMHFVPNGANIWLGGNGQDGDLYMFPRGVSDNNDPSLANIHLDGQNGNIILKSHDGNERMHFVPNGANIWLGGKGQDGDLYIFPRGVSDNNDPSLANIHLDGQNGNIILKSHDGNERMHFVPNGANIWLGGKGQDGDLYIFPRDASDNNNASHATIHLDGQNGNIALSGNIVLSDRNGNDHITMDAREHNLLMKDASGDAIVELGRDGNLRLGGHGVDGDILLFPSSAMDISDNSQATIWMDADSGDIRLSGADCAEDFDILESEQIEPGTVLVVAGQEIALQQSRKAYDKRVVGVASGAGGYKPGIILNKNDSQAKRMPVALNGKVYCKVDASYAPIEIGDLLTTSNTPGHAMKAIDSMMAFGAVLGKALLPLEKGKGLIPVLVALQ